jgi:hypothetical protein
MVTGENPTTWIAAVTRYVYMHDITTTTGYRLYTMDSATLDKSTMP